MRLLSIPSAQQNKKYLAIATSIRRAILSGQLAPNDKLPASRTLASQMQVNRHTIMAACDELVAQGYLINLPRVGYKVVENLPVQGADTGEQNKHQSFQLTHLFKTQKERVAATSSHYRFNFAGGLPDLARFPKSAFKSYLSGALNKLSNDQLHYQEGLGNTELIQQIQLYLAKARGLLNAEVLITNGSQEALYIVAKSILNAGDGVAIEQYSYPPACAALTSCGGSLFSVEQDEFGIRPESLQALLNKQSIKLLYLTPLHQYPTTVTLSPQRRTRIYQLAREYDFLILEDDYDHEFHYRCSPLTPMAANDPDGRIIYISTFSKIMFAGARLGYISAHKEVVNLLANTKKIINHKNECILQLAVANWMADGSFERHLRKMTSLYMRRRDHMVAQLNQYRAKGYPISFKVPDGGMAIWLGCRRDLTNMTELARDNGLFIQCQQDFSPFTLKLSSSFLQYMRLGFASMDDETREKALSELMLLLFGELG